MTICCLWLNLVLLWLGIRLGFVAMCLNTLLREILSNIELDVKTWL